MKSEINESRIKSFFSKELGTDPASIEISQFAGGYSNLTFKIKTSDKTYVLRRAPFGDKISKAHDMKREFNVLVALEKAGYPSIPKPILYNEDLEVIGAPFFVMSHIDGLILRNKLPKDLEISAEEFSTLSRSSISCLVELHGLELQNSGLADLGKPEGYVERQVTGWSERYFKAKTNQLPELEAAIAYLNENLPKSEAVAFIHNDFKYDNLILDPDDFSQIRGVLDWEMATVGDPMMDLGTTLAYWSEAGDPHILKNFNSTHHPGNMTRQEVIHFYSEKSGREPKNQAFYYVFGLVKVAVIAQQIYRRFKLGHAADPRFAALIMVTEACGKLAVKTLETQKI